MIYLKRGAAKRFVIVDAAMNDLIRPTLYEAYHAIRPVAEAPADAVLAPMDVVGPICETGDYLALDRRLPPVAAGDLLAIDGAGAYASVMASSYNSRPPAAEVLVTGNRFAVIRARPTYDDMLARDHIPDWLGPPLRQGSA